MSAGQELLLRRSLTNQFVPLVSAQVPLFGLMGRCPRGYGRGWANVTANLPNDAFTIPSNCTRHGDKNPDANILFWLNLTLFRMNTCAKMVGGWGVPISTLTPTSRGGHELSEQRN